MNKQNDGQRNTAPAIDRDPGTGQPRPATHETDTGIGRSGGEDGTGGLVEEGRTTEGTGLPGYGDQGAGGTTDEINDPLTASGDVTAEEIARRRHRAPDQILDTGMGHFGGAGASGGTGPDIGRTGADL